MPSGYKFIAGNHWTICERCGLKYRASSLKREWTGLWVCEPCYESRHAQDFVRAVKDNYPVYPALPEQTDTFVYRCSTRSATAGEAIAGCAIVGFKESDDNEIPSGTFNTNTL